MYPFVPITSHTHNQNLNRAQLIDIHIMVQHAPSSGMCEATLSACPTKIRIALKKGPWSWCVEINRTWRSLPPTLSLTKWKSILTCPSMGNRICPYICSPILSHHNVGAFVRGTRSLNKKDCCYVNSAAMSASALNSNSGGGPSNSLLFTRRPQDEGN